jgi:hypothetical protein
MHVHDGQLFGLPGSDGTGRRVDQKPIHELDAQRPIGFGAPTANLIAAPGCGHEPLPTCPQPATMVSKNPFEEGSGTFGRKIQGRTSAPALMPCGFGFTFLAKSRHVLAIKGLEVAMASEVWAEPSVLMPLRRQLSGESLTQLRC